MKRICLSIFITLILLTFLCPAQTSVQPTELEQAKLAKLKAQSETLQQQLQTIDVQIQALNVMKQNLQYQYQQKHSELLGLAETIKENHKEWGNSKDITFNPLNGESGQFTKQDKKEEQKK